MPPEGRPPGRVISGLSGPRAPFAGVGSSRRGERLACGGTAGSSPGTIGLLPAHPVQPHNGKLPYGIILADTSTGESSVLCYVLTHQEAQQIVSDLNEQHPDMRFAVVPDEDEE